MVKSSLFGTDGIRGRFGEAPIDKCTLKALACALVSTFPRSSDAPFYIARDTRESGPIIITWLTEELTRGGIKVIDLGILPTPALAYIARAELSLGGCMISASHNPWEDNGLKFFTPEGMKYNNATERHLTQLVSEKAAHPIMPGDIRLLSKHSMVEGFLGRGDRKTTAYPGIREDFEGGSDDKSTRQTMFGKKSIVRKDLHMLYFKHLLHAVPSLDLSGKTLVLDCAHGAYFELARKILEHLGANVYSIASSPDGRNINKNCGSTSPKNLQQAVKAHKADFGIAFDGDGDRTLLALEDGTLLNGDQILTWLALGAKSDGKLEPPVVVSTIMANGAMEEKLSAHGIRLLRTPVGDRYVWEAMQESGALFGGEASGHLILKNHSTTGDGLLVALSILKVLSTQDAPQLAFAPYPHRIENIPLTHVAPSTLKNLQTTEGKLKKLVQPKGRLSLRKSGTEPLLRLMVEMPTEQEVQRVLQQAQGML